MTIIHLVQTIKSLFELICIGMVILFFIGIAILWIIEYFEKRKK